MGGMSSQVLWKQALNSDAESTLRQAVGSLRGSVHELPSQAWERSTLSIGGVRDYKTSYLAPASQAWSSVMLHLNSLIAEPLANELSRLVGGYSMALFEYDQAAWGYCLYKNGSLIDRFWNIPALVEIQPEECKGSAGTISSVFEVPLGMVVPYIQHISEADYGAKAFVDDEFTLGDHWARVDFIRRLGLTYPNPGQVAGGRYLKVEEPRR